MNRATEMIKTAGFGSAILGGAKTLATKAWNSGAYKKVDGLVNKGLERVGQGQKSVTGFGANKGERAALLGITGTLGATAMSSGGSNDNTQAGKV